MSATDERGAEKAGGQIRRKFIWAPDMHKLAERVEASEKAAEEARELFEKMEDKPDDLERLVWIVAVARDVKRGLKSVDDLQEECDKVIEGLGDELPDGAAIAIKRVAT
jgi:hypothetical protein